MMYIEMDGCKYISEVDYLKVAEEKERLEIKLEHYKDYIRCLEKEKREKDEEIEKLRISLNNSIKEVCERNKELLKQDKKIEELEKQNEYYGKEYERLKERIEKADSRVESYEEWYNNNVYEFNKMKEENERLKNLYESEQQYEEWCELSYTYYAEGVNKNIIQNMLLEDAFELIGMDSDNWVGFSVEKYKKEVK